MQSGAGTCEASALVRICRSKIGKLVCQAQSAQIFTFGEYPASPPTLRLVFSLVRELVRATAWRSQRCAAYCVSSILPGEEMIHAISTKSVIPTNSISTGNTQLPPPKKDCNFDTKLQSFLTKSAFVGINPLTWMKSLRDVQFMEYRSIADLLNKRLVFS